MLRDANKNISSKRVAGFFAVLVAAGLSFFAVKQDPSIAGALVWSWLAFAGGVLGVTLLEKKKE